MPGHLDTVFPKLERLRGEGGRDGIDEGHRFAVLAAEPVAAIDTWVGIGGLIGGQRGGFLGRLATIDKRRGAGPSGEDPDTQELCVDIGAGEFGSKFAQESLCEKDSG